MVALLNETISLLTGSDDPKSQSGYLDAQPRHRLNSSV